MIKQWMKKILCGVLALTVFAGSMVATELTPLASGEERIPPSVDPVPAGQIVWNGVEAGALDGGSGTREDPYRIANAAQFMYFRNRLASAATADEYYVLTGHVYLNDSEYHAAEGTKPNTLKPVGTDGLPGFAGHLDGAGYAIYYPAYPGDNYTQTSLFGTLSGAVSNLTIQAPLLSAINMGAAALAITLTGTLDNCHVIDADIRGYSAGGLVVSAGEGTPVIRNCTVSGTILGARTTQSNLGSAGGILSASNSRGSHLTVEGCINYATVTTNTGTRTLGSSLGGIIGNAGNDAGNLLTLRDCVNYGTVEQAFDTGRSGGLVGYVYRVSTLTVTECRNEAAVSGGAYAGGFLGLSDQGNNAASSRVNIANSVNRGSVTATGLAAGGFVGGNRNAKTDLTATNSVNLGAVTGAVAAGGFIGELTPDYNSADVARIHNCAAVCDVTATAGAAGGALGTFANAKTNGSGVSLNVCVLRGAVTGTTAAGAVIGAEAASGSDVRGLCEVQDSVLFATVTASAGTAAVLSGSALSSDLTAAVAGSRFGVRVIGAAGESTTPYAYYTVVTDGEVRTQVGVTLPLPSVTQNELVDGGVTDVLNSRARIAEYALWYTSTAHGVPLPVVALTLRGVRAGLGSRVELCFDLPEIKGISLDEVSVVDEAGNQYAAAADWITISGKRYPAVLFRVPVDMRDAMTPHTYRLKVGETYALRTETYTLVDYLADIYDPEPTDVASVAERKLITSLLTYTYYAGVTTVFDTFNRTAGTAFTPSLEWEQNPIVDTGAAGVTCAMDLVGGVELVITSPDGVEVTVPGYSVRHPSADLYVVEGLGVTDLNTELTVVYADGRRVERFTIGTLLNAYMRGTDSSAANLARSVAIYMDAAVQYRDALDFMAREGGRHDWDGGSVTLAPTCVETGIRSFICQNCGMTRNDVIEATGVHIPDSGRTTVSATCETAGTYTNFCTMCRCVMQESVIPAKGHNWVSPDRIQFTEGAFVKSFTCKTCLKNELRPVGKIESSVDTMYDWDTILSGENNRIAEAWWGFQAAYPAAQWSNCVALFRGTTKPNVGVVADSEALAYLAGSDSLGYAGCRNTTPKTYATLALAVEALAKTENRPISYVLAERTAALAAVADRTDLSVVDVPLTDSGLVLIAPLDNTVIRNCTTAQEILRIINPHDMYAYDPDTKAVTLYFDGDLTDRELYGYNWQALQVNTKVNGSVIDNIKDADVAFLQMDLWYEAGKFPGWILSRDDQLGYIEPDGSCWTWETHKRDGDPVQFGQLTPGWNTVTIVAVSQYNGMGEITNLNFYLGVGVDASLGMTPEQFASMTLMTSNIRYNYANWRNPRQLIFIVPDSGLGTRENPSEIRFRNLKEGALYFSCGHSTVSSHDALAPTCKEPGYTAGTRCDECGQWLTGHEKLTSDHEWDAGVIVREGSCDTVELLLRTCTKCGDQRYEEGKYRHSYSDDWSHDSLYHWHSATCGHDAQDARALHRFEDGGACAVCGYVPAGTQDTDLIFTRDGDGWTVSGRTGNAAVIWIPETHLGEPVTGVAAGAFRGDTAVTELVIHDGVLRIGAGAFAGCTALGTVILPESLTEIADDAFADAPIRTATVSTEHVRYMPIAALESLTLSCGTILRDSALRGASNLRSVTFAASVKTIEADAFTGCTALTDVRYLGTLSGWTKIECHSSPLVCGVTLYIEGSRAYQVPANLPGRDNSPYTDFVTQTPSTLGSAALSAYDTAAYFPNIETIIARGRGEVPIYGIYAWTEDYDTYSSSIEKIGFTNMRTNSTSMTPARFLKLVRSGIRVMVTPGVGAAAYLKPESQGKAQADLTPEDYDLDAWFRANTDKALNFLRRWGPNGTIFTDTTTTVTDPDTGETVLLYDLLHDADGNVLYESPVDSMEVFNEPNFQYMTGHSNPWLTLKQYMYGYLQNAFYPAIKAEFPTIRVIGFGAGGASSADVGFISMTLEKVAGAADSMDVLSTHPYIDETSPFAGSNQYGDHSIGSQLANIRKILDQYGRGDLPIWYTECGWAVKHSEGGHYSTEFGTDQATQAAMLVQEYIYGMRVGVERINYMYIMDTDNCNYGLINRSDGSWRKSAYAIRTLTTILPDPRLTGVIGNEGRDAAGNVNQVFVYTFESRPGGPEVVVAFSALDVQTVTIPWEEACAFLTDIYGNTRLVLAENGQITLTVGKEMQYLSHVGDTVIHPVPDGN